MTRFYLSGQNTFANRGCEAIVRSTVKLLQAQLGDVEVLVPSNDIERDNKQWPEANKNGVRFIQDYNPFYTRYWVHLQRLPVPLLKQAGWPFPMPTALKKHIASVDAVLAIGGDNYSLDYRIPSLWMGIDKLAMDMNKPVIIWGASVGPFEKEPMFLPAIIKHLSHMKKVAVRETVSYQYLTKKLGLTNVIQMADPAFTLSKQQVEYESFWPRVEKTEEGVLGLNISPLIEKYKKSGQDLRKETSDFIRYVVQEKKMGVLLIPHVTPLDGSIDNNDAHYMNTILENVSDLNDSVKMMPHQLNASQIKYIISKLRFFIGARTHATIAALSSGVPTVSIAYSVKAIGINKDIFGNENPILKTPNLSNLTLRSSLEWLLSEEDSLRDILALRIPQLQDAAIDGTKTCLEAINDK